MIEDTQASDNGNYGCMAQNDAGEAISGPATLIVQRETNSIIGNYFYTLYYVIIWGIRP